jgi:hypothetical protein
MYNTVQELHNAIDLGLQHISSNRKQSISKFHKDMALNYAVLQYVDTRTSPRSNTKGKGFEENQKRYDDLRELKRVVTLPTYIPTDFSGENRVYSILPSDYLRATITTSKVSYNKFGLVVSHAPSATSIAYLNFPDDMSSGAKYQNFRIDQTIGNNTTTIFGISPMHRFPDVFSVDAKFMIINLVLNHFSRNDEIKVYWERYDSIYRPDTFIIVSNIGGIFSLLYAGSQTNSVSDVITRSMVTNTINKRAANDLVSSQYRSSMLDNHHYRRNRHSNPITTIENKRLYVDCDDTFVVPSVNLEYLKRPTVIDHVTNSMCELSMNREVIDLAVQRLKAYIKDEGYQHIVNENQFNE